MQIFSERDVNKEQLESRKITILGFGSQGRAHAMNLKDSGLNVVVGLRQNGSSWDKAIDDGLNVLEPDEAVFDSDLISFLVPDMAQPELYASLESKIKNSATLLFAHGFNIHYQQINPRNDLDVILIAPKSPGDLVRRQYKQGKGVPCLMAVERDNSGQAQANAMAYAHGIGGSRAGILTTTFAEETETDLFGEQAVLCGGVTELIVTGFDTLVDAGYQPEVAYFECMHELKLIVDLLYEGGIKKMHEFVSETAIYGDLSRGPRIINSETKERMKTILEEVQNKTFAQEWIEENKTGKENYNRMMDEDQSQQIEKVGKELRERMSWLKN
ncbi:MAG: ketol-acid reductoisomerase [Gammaproteobacteria bacterium]|nr:ketol-acid reductoisomerase [Gammaproteobacteria bacterium]|tara:strand:- start:894 stop:1880 length:987 start_codon:yes stop_codon:yes gene_type:complete